MTDPQLQPPVPERGADCSGRHGKAVVWGGHIPRPQGSGVWGVISVRGLVSVFVFVFLKKQTNMKVTRFTVTLGLGRRLENLGWRIASVWLSGGSEGGEGPSRPFPAPHGNHEIFRPLTPQTLEERTRLQVSELLLRFLPQPPRPTPRQQKISACQPGPAHFSAQGNF